MPMNAPYVVSKVIYYVVMDAPVVFIEGVLAWGVVRSCQRGNGCVLSVRLGMAARW